MVYFQEYVVRWKIGQTRVVSKKDSNLHVRHVEGTAGFTSITPAPRRTHVPITFMSVIAGWVWRSHARKSTLKICTYM